jgi:predicted RNA-binding protein with PIN domain
VVEAARLIVDGMNLIGSRAGGWWRDRAGAMGALVEELDSHVASSGEEVTVVFDGRPIELPAREHVGVRFASRRGRNAADDEIAAMVAADADPATLEVVTSDRELRGRVLERGARVCPVSAFRRRLEAQDPQGPDVKAKRR